MEILGSTRDNNKHETHGWVNLSPSPLPHAVIGGPWPTMFCGADSVLVGTKDILGAHDERFRGDQGDPWGSPCPNVRIQVLQAVHSLTKELLEVQNAR